jgi:hypothetical protein
MVSYIKEKMVATAAISGIFEGPSESNQGILCSRLTELSSNEGSFLGFPPPPLLVRNTRLCSSWEPAPRPPVARFARTPSYVFTTMPPSSSEASHGGSGGLASQEEYNRAILSLVVMRLGHKMAFTDSRSRVLRPLEPFFT